MKSETKKAIKELVLEAIRKKIQDYSRESIYVPFFESLFDKKTIVSASIVQSLYTTFGMSMYEQIALILCKEAGYFAKRQYDLLGEIDDGTEILIRNILDKPRNTKRDEIEEIRKGIKKGSAKKHSESVVDVFLRNNVSEIYIDIKTVKPNLDGFKGMRRKMLEWVALRLSQDRNAKIDVFIGIPYNPYFPEDYNRWTAKVCKKEDLLIQEELWKTFAGYDVFNELIDVFKEIGKEAKKEVDRLVDGK